VYRGEKENLRFNFWGIKQRRVVSLLAEKVGRGMVAFDIHYIYFLVSETIKEKDITTILE
jgi:hypothetical protein